MTKKTDVVIPEVLADMVDAKLAAQIKFTQYADVNTDLVGVPGDKVKFPSWNYVGDAVDVAEGVEVGLSDMSATTKEFTIKKAMKAIGITEEVANSAYGDPMGQAASQLAKAIASKVDNDVLDEAYTAPIVVNESDHVIGYDGIVDAVTKFEDEEHTDKVMWIHPRQEGSLLKDDDFISADKFEAGVAVNGSIGKIAGCWIKKSAKVKQVDAVTAVTGVYNITIDTKAASGDTITINGVPLVAGTDFALTTNSATGNAAALASALNLSTNTDISCYTWTSSGAVLTATEDSGKEGTAGLTVSVEKAAGSGTMVVSYAVGTRGVAAAYASYLNPIIKVETDSEDTEDTAAAITVFLKKDTSLDHEWKPRTQTHEFTAAKYYGVGLTNASKVIIAKFGQSNAS